MQIKYLLTSHTKLPCPRQGLPGGFSTNDYESEMVVIIYKKIVRAFLMDGMTKSEPAINRACSELYHPVVKFRLTT